jgi:hypothetical protein
VASDLTTELASMLQKVRAVVITKKLNSTNFAVGEKVFAFTKGDGVVLKLPPETVKSLVASKAAAMLVMGKRTMKEWVVLHYRTPRGSSMDLPLFKKAMEYVSSNKR